MARADRIAAFHLKWTFDNQRQRVKIVRQTSI